MLSLTQSCKKFLAAREAKDQAMLEALFGGIPADDIEVTLLTLKRVEMNMPRTGHCANEVTRSNEHENENEAANE